MDERELYLFDLQGFLVVPEALSTSSIERLNELVDSFVTAAERSQPWQRFDRLLSWGPVMRSLIDLPAIAPYLPVLLGPRFRLDHTYIHIIRQGRGPIGTHLHGGGTPFDPCQYYVSRDGRPYNGLTAVAYNLTDVNPGDGGFGCIPGSHKSHVVLPEAWRDLSDSNPCSIEVAGKAGTAIIFTEALTHGTMPWRGQGERRTLFFKYSPGHSAWHREYYRAEDYPDLSDRQRQILLPPGIYPG
ncbi:MAG: phytanoyl-CoA dioxygenase family protein [Cyanobacteria bacterium P01_D01_bin.123]